MLPVCSVPLMYGSITILTESFAHAAWDSELQEYEAVIHAQL
jgi:hypothetical protein